MIIFLLFLIILLWLVGYITLPLLIIPTIPLFVFNNHTITLWNIILFIVFLWLISLLPRPFREIASIIFILWVLSVLGLFFFAGLGSWLVGIIIVGLIILILAGAV